MIEALLKPKEILTKSVNNEKLSAAHYLQLLASSFVKENLELLEAKQSDAEAIVKFRNARFTTPNRYTAYWMYHLTSFGNSVVLKNSKEEIVGCFLEVSYADPKRTSYHVLVAVAEPYTGKHIAARLIQYVCLKALKVGSLVAKGTISPDNFGSLSSFVNHSGAVLTEYVEDFSGFGPRFIFEIPLKIEGIMHQHIDKDLVLKLYEGEVKLKRDYRFISANDIDRVESVYKETNNRIIAVLKKPITHEPLFLLTSFPNLDIQGK